MHKTLNNIVNVKNIHLLFSSRHLQHRLSTVLSRRYRHMRDIQSHRGRMQPIASRTQDYGEHSSYILCLFTHDGSCSSSPLRMRAFVLSCDQPAVCSLCLRDSMRMRTLVVHPVDRPCQQRHRLGHHMGCKDNEYPDGMDCPSPVGHHRTATRHNHDMHLLSYINDSNI